MPDWFVNILTFLIIASVFGVIIFLGWKLFVWGARTNKKIMDNILKD